MKNVYVFNWKGVPYAFGTEAEALRHLHDLKVSTLPDIYKVKVIKRRYTRKITPPSTGDVHVHITVGK